MIPDCPDCAFSAVARVTDLLDKHTGDTIPTQTVADALNGVGWEENA